MQVLVLLGPDKSLDKFLLKYKDTQNRESLKLEKCTKCLKIFGIPDTYYAHGSSKLAEFEKSCGQELKEGLGIGGTFLLKQWEGPSSHKVRYSTWRSTWQNLRVVIPESLGH